MLGSIGPTCLKPQQRLCVPPAAERGSEPFQEWPVPAAPCSSLLSLSFCFEGVHC